MMAAIFDGMRAGFLSALLLTLVAFLTVAGGMNSASEATGMLFVATAFGLVGLPQILYGLGVGALVAIWATVLKRTGLLPLSEGLREGGRDRQVASALVVFPMLVGLVAGGVMGAHLLVTSNFNRVGFQAQGLGLVAAGMTAGGVLISPLLYGVIGGILERLPVKAERPIFTLSVVGVYGAGGLAVVLMGYRYASGLHVWSTTELWMGLGFVLVVPMLTALMVRFRWERGAWLYGVPVAALLVAMGCFWGAQTWATSTASMRAATFRHAPLVSAVAGRVIDLGRGDETLFAYGDCEEEDEDCVVEGKVIPVTSAEHPARRAVQLAVAAGDQAQVNEFESLPEPPKNVVMIMIDTLRQDHLGFTGYFRETSPTIDAIAEDGVAFMDAYATSPHTPRSLPPLFFGRYASRMLWNGAQYNFPRVRPEALSMFEVLEEQGYRTIGIMSHFYFDERRGVNQGFEVWDNHDAVSLEESHTDIATPRIWGKVEPVIEELGEEQRRLGEEARPFALFVHFFDPHSRWDYHEEFGFERGSTPRERHISAYDSEIAHADKYLGYLVEKLKEEGLYEKVIFVITSDHGEAFNEHGYYFHGQNLYNQVMNVPMILRVPGWYARQVEGAVSIIDIAPTVLDLVGVTIPTEFEGRSRSQEMLGRKEVEVEPIFMELLPYTAFQEHHRAVVYGDQKLIVNFTLGVEEFYDLAEDPGEQQNLIGERGEDAARLGAMLEEFMER